MKLRIGNLSLAVLVLSVFVFLPFSAGAEAPSEKDAVSKSADQRFWDMGDGTVYDSKTHLMWMQKDYWQMKAKWLNWYTAKEFVMRMNNKKFAGHSDWRLATVEEASKLYQRRKRNQDKDGDKIYIDRIFPKGAGWATWTSEEKGAKAVVVSYKDEGGTEYQDKISGTDAFLRLVRGPLDK